MWEYSDPYNWEVGNWAKFVCAGQAVVGNMYPTQGGTFHLIICLYYSHLLDDCLKVWFIKLGWRKFGVRPQVKYCRQKWVINLSFRYHESLNSSFLKYFSSMSLAISLKVSFSEWKRVVLLMGSVQISLCSFVCECEESWC